MNKYGKIFSLIIMFVLLFESIVLADISIYVDDIKLDESAELLGDRTIVPMRSIFESLGAEVEWFSENQSILATKGSKILALKIGVERLVVRDIETKENFVINLDVAPVLKNNKTMVPVRAVSEALNAKVEWNEEKQVVYIYKN